MADVEVIREASPIEDVAAQYTDLKKSGDRLVGLCPFHRETSGSFTIFPETQSWYCFGCRNGGDVFDLVMRKERVSFVEALNRLAARAHISLESEHCGEWQERRAIIDALSLATVYYHQSLMKETRVGQWCRDYLSSRCVRPESIEELMIGFASGSGLLPFLREHAVGDAVAIKAGLLMESNGRLQEFFRGRIIFPHLKGGRTSYLQGRAIGNSDPKYLGLAGTKELFASTYRRGSSALIIVEGPMDAIALWQWGFSVVSLAGTALTANSLEHVEQHLQVYVCLDNDAGGNSGSRTLLEKLFPRSKLASLPQGVDDPSDFAKQGHTKEEFHEILLSAPDFVEFAISEIPPDTDKVKLVDHLECVFVKLSALEPTKAEAYLVHRIGTRFGLKTSELNACRSTIADMRRERRRKLHASTEDMPRESSVTIRQDKIEEVDPKVRLQAQELLLDPALLYRAGHVIQRLGVAGELCNRLLTYLSVTSRILAKPISITLKGESSSGKSYVVERVLALFPPSAYIAVTGLSRQALVYRAEEFSHRTIVVFERPGMEAADYNIRTLQTEGKLVFEVAEKNPGTNRWETRRVEKEGPVNFIFTTTSPELHAENETRHWSLLTDESPQQTAAAKMESAKRYSVTETVSEVELAAWRQLQLELKPLRVSIPYAVWLSQHTPNVPLRIRRDFSRLLALVEVIALLHQKQRPICEGGALVATLADYHMARELADEVFPASLSRINKKVESLIHQVRNVFAEKRARGEADAVVTPAEIAAAMDTSASSVSRWLRPAVEVGLVDVVSETGKGRIRSVKPGAADRALKTALPSIEEMAEAFPELARGFRSVRPLTGEEVALEEEGTVARQEYSGVES